MSKQINESPEISSAVMCKTKNWIKVKFSTCLEHFLIKILGFFFFFAPAWVTQFRCAVPMCVCGGGGGWPERDLVSSSIAFPYFLVSGSLTEPKLVILVRFAGWPVSCDFWGWAYRYVLLCLALFPSTEHSNLVPHAFIATALPSQSAISSVP